MLVIDEILTMPLWILCLRFEHVQLNRYRNFHDQQAEGAPELFDGVRWK